MMSWLGDRVRALHVGTILYYAGMFDEVLQEYRKALELEPMFASVREDPRFRSLVSRIGAT